jgi:hypothetical protein
MSRNQLYVILGVACVAGYSWLFYSIINHGDSGTFSPCIFKAETGFPCPSCGSTRALMMLLRGDIAGSLLTNPIGLLLGLLLLIVPFWILFDLITRNATLLQFYKNAEKTIRKKPVALLLILLILANWCWNIYKHL